LSRKMCRRRTGSAFAFGRGRPARALSAVGGRPSHARALSLLSPSVVRGAPPLHRANPFASDSRVCSGEARIILLLSRPPLLPVSRHGHCVYTHCTDDGRRSAYALRDCNYLQHGTRNALSLPTAHPRRTDRQPASHTTVPRTTRLSVVSLMNAVTTHGRHRC